MQKIILRLIGIYFNILCRFIPRFGAKIGFKFFCDPRRKPLKDYEKKFLNTAEQEVLHLANHEIMTYRWGAGDKKVLLLHGWASSTFRWKSIIEGLTDRGCNVIAFDAPAHGQSSGKMLNAKIYGEAIAAFFQKEGSIDHCITHSFGGFSLLYTFYRWPALASHLRSMIILATPGKADDFFTFYKSTLGLKNSTVQVLKNKFKDEIGFTSADMNIVQFSKNIMTPTLIIHDTDDQETPYGHAVELSIVKPNTSLFTTNGLGHKLKSDTVNEQIYTFIGKIDTQL